MKVLNLDAIVSEDKRVTIGGKDYIIPGDLPVSTMFKSLDNNNSVEKNPNDPRNLKRAFEELADILNIRQSGVTVEWLIATLSSRQFTALTQFIFKNEESEDGKKPSGEQTEEKESPTNLTP